MAIYPMRVCFGAVRGGGLGSHIYDAPKEREERRGVVVVLAVVHPRAYASAPRIKHPSGGNVNSKKLWNPIHTEVTSGYSRVPTAI